MYVCMYVYCIYLVRDFFFPFKHFLKMIWLKSLMQYIMVYVFFFFLMFAFFNMQCFLLTLLTKD